jgi:hypothetical protein
MVKLGEKVRDRITGFNGTVMARTEYLNGCISYAILPEKLKDGNPQEWVWIDEQRLDPLSPAKRGGPQPSAPTKN